MTTNRTCDSFFVNSFPRSGNTWLRAMLKEIIRPEIYDHDPLFVKYPFFTYRKFPRINFEEIAKNKNAMIKSHGKWCECAPSIAKVYIVRDGRDAYYSYYHFNMDHRGYNETWDSYFKRHIIDKKMKDKRECFLSRWMGDWSENVKSYLERNDTLVVKYEDLRQHTHEELSKILSFVSASAIDSETLTSCVESFNDSLRKKRDAHDRPRGVSAWQDFLTDEQNEQFWSIHGQTLSKFGYRETK